jgi:membrane-associated phospholipid phosphatase
MFKIKKTPLKATGILGVIICLAAFIHEPSFPTPDKLIIFLFFCFMIFGQVREGFKRFAPFIILILAYESFRGMADQLNSHVDYTLAPHVDRVLFGNLPTVYLQGWLWRGHTSWYDFVLYLPYFLHFIIPLGLGLLIWRTRDKYFWQVMNTFLVVAFGAFITFLLFPTAPPWLASQNHYIQPITRISSQVWSSLGIHNFPSLYNHISPNAVAAVPSLHAAWATLLFIFVYKIYGRRWAFLSAIYPALIFIGTIYEAEHYAFDVIAGVIYATAGYYLTPWLMRMAKIKVARFKTSRSSNTRSV